MPTFRRTSDWTNAYVRCPICGRRQYGRRSNNWRPRERVCKECFKNYTSEDIDSMLNWLQRRGGSIFLVEWKRRRGAGK